MSEFYLRFTSLRCKLYINVSYHDPSRNILIMKQDACIHPVFYLRVSTLCQFNTKYSGCIDEHDTASTFKE